MRQGGRKMICPIHGDVILPACSLCQRGLEKRRRQLQLARFDLWLCRVEKRYGFFLDVAILLIALVLTVLFFAVSWFMGNAYGGL